MSSRSLFERARGRAERIAMRSSAPVQSLYFSVFSSAFRRERRAVAAGIAKHAREPELKEVAFALRKSVHTLEKGLTMRPRRAEFGLSLVGPAIDGYAKIARRWPEALRGAEGDWLASVLHGYFEATATSTAPAIVAARARFADVVEQLSPPLASGPHPPRRSADVATFPALRALAQQRGSVRWFQNRQVDRALVDNAVAVAQESPTACNRQPYRYLVFDEPSAVRAVSDIPMGTRGWGTQIPSIAVLVGDLSAYVDERDRHLIYIDSALSAQAFLLGLESQGIASCVVNWPDIAAREARMRALLDLRPYERVIMLIAFGYADDEGLVPFSAKRDIESTREYRTI